MKETPSWWVGANADPVTLFCHAIVTGDLTAAREALARSRAAAKATPSPRPSGTREHGEAGGAVTNAVVTPVHLIRDREAPAAWRLIRNGRGKDATLLHEAALFAAAHGHISIVRLLVRAGAEVDALDMYGYGALHQAALTNNAAACRLLLDAGASIDAQSVKGYTPLHTAIYKRCNESATLLLERGASLKLTNQRGESPLAYAERHDRRELLTRLEAAAAKRAAERVLRRLAPGQGKR